MEQLFKLLVLFFGMLDSYKYHYIAKKIAKYESTKGASRKFTNIAIIYRILLFLYAYFYLHDWVIYISCLIGLYTLAETFYTHYVHYPYKNKKERILKDLQYSNILFTV